MSLSNTAKEVAVNHFLSDYPLEEANEAFDMIMEDPENLYECEVWEVFDNYPVEKVANWIKNLAEAVQEAMDEAVKASNMDKK